MMLTRLLLQQKITLLEPFTGDETAEFTVSAARDLLNFMDKIESLEKRTATPVKLPYCSASPVCEIEAGYAAGVSDCREAIRRAGYPIEGDD
ncbi:hypothetical protein [Citrobacter sp. wls620]|uniref:hypothetical protein n=1 Tax=Citrobacter sp. wls620 TaxID=2576431 RepID=UPI0010C9AC32|nr:hypothetical protein [Citrobacter sp. wls620]TKU95159.1 hypothetical protein FDW90_06230 [Citrobacter sp. wls620]